VRGTELHERRVSTEIPIIAGPGTPLDRRRIGAGRADRAEWVGNGSGRGRGIRLAAFLRNWLADVRTRRVVIDQGRRIGLHALVPRDRALQCQAARRAPDQRGLDAANAEVLSVGVVEQIADHAGIEERDLNVVQFS